MYVLKQHKLSTLKESIRILSWWKQKPGVEGMIALSPVASQIPEKNVFLVTKVTDKKHVSPKSSVLELTRLKKFLVERRFNSLWLQVYDPKTGKLHPRELYALQEVYLHKK